MVALVNDCWLHLYYLHRFLPSSSGDISGNSRVGGLVGYGSSTITKSINSGTVSATIGSGSNVSGFVGFGSSIITNSSNIGAVIGTRYVGGLVGYGSTVTITNSSNSAAVSCLSYVGGLVGSSDSVYIYYSINFGDVIATDNTTALGGLIGYDTVNKDIEHSYFTGNLTSYNVNVNGILFGEKIDVTLLDEAFFIEVLGWDPFVMFKNY